MLPDTMLISTQYGFMFLKLKPYDAPLTCLNMYKLAKLNFFANNFIHRVVRIFVIQSGDNTGTAKAGRDIPFVQKYLRFRYDEMGAVGMASNGKERKAPNGLSLTARPRI